MKVKVFSIALVAIFVVSSNAHSRGAPACTNTKASCVNMQEFDRTACQCYCPYGRRGPSWGCDSNKRWDRTSCDCACQATIPAGGCGLGEWNKERCACYCPRPEGPVPSGKTWARHPTCAYVCRNPKPVNLPTFKQWNEEKCRVECIPTKPDPIPAGKRWCEDCCELSCVATTPCSHTIPANKHWDTNTCSVECIKLKPADVDIPSNKQWNDVTCALECKEPESIQGTYPTYKQWSTETCALVCKDPVPDVIAANKQWSTETCKVECKNIVPAGEIPASKKWDTDTCAVVCIESAPNPVTISANQRWSTDTCSLECTLSSSDCNSPKALDLSDCSCKCPIGVACAAGYTHNDQFCACLSNTARSNKCTTQPIATRSGCFYLTLDASGDAVLYKKDGTVLWKAGTTGGVRICVNYFSYWGVLDSSYTAVWKSTLISVIGSSLVIQENGDLQVVDSSGVIYWQSNTAQSVTTC